MKIALLYGKQDIRMSTAPDPTPGPHEVVVKVAFSGVCGTDLHAWNGWASSRYGGFERGPQNVCHEFSGIVAEIGSAVRSCAVRDRVTIAPYVTCRLCYYCRNGYPNLCPDKRVFRDGWAEYVRVEEYAVYKLREEISLEVASMAEPLSVGMQAIDEAQGHLKSGSIALVIGGGPIGLGTMMLARHSGAAIIILSEPSEYRRDLARKLGADVIVDPLTEDLGEVVRRETDGVGVDVAFEAVTLVRNGGLVVVVGNAPPDDAWTIKPAGLIHSRGVDIRGSFNRAWGFERTLRWMRRLDFAPMLTHTYPLEQVNDAFHLAHKGLSGKILLTP